MEIIFTIIGILALMLGLAFIGVTSILGLRKWIKIKRSASTTGVVVSNETTTGMRYDSDPRSTLYKPTVRFQTADGRIVDHAPKISTNVSNYTVGQKVPVHYDPQKPEEAMVGATFRLWFSLIILGLVGGVFALVGTMFIVITQGGKIFHTILR